MDVLNDFIARFAGYGSAAAPIWFVGMEEGGGHDVAELERRLSAWEARGRQPFEDLSGYHGAIGLDRHFLPPYPLQRTWGPLCRTLLAWRGEVPNTARVREVQRMGLGARDGHASLLELLPLPAAGTAVWPYAQLSARLPELASRDAYAAAVIPRRIAMLRALVQESRPQAIVFYGQAYLNYWAEVVGAPVSPVSIAGRRSFVATATSSYCMAVPHPVARGLGNDFWEAVGHHLRANVW